LKEHIILHKVIEHLCGVDDTSHSHMLESCNSTVAMMLLNEFTL